MVNGLTGDPIHQGALGLPDFGVSEFVGGLFGQGRNAQGGSDIFSTNKASTQTPMQDTGSVLGTQTQATPPSTVNPNGNGLGSLINSGSSPTASKTAAPTTSGMPAVPAPDTNAIGSSYAPLIDYLNQAEGQLRSDFPTYAQDINNQADTAKQSLTNGYNTTNQTLQNQQAQGGKQKEDVISAARRLFQELQQGNLQRFGGSSSAGQAASELQGREFQRNSASAQNQYTDLVQQLGQKKLEVDNNYQVGLKQIEDQKAAAINQVNRDFQDKLSQINSQRAQTESAKAQARLGALQDYRNQVYSIQLQNYQFQQQLNQQKSQADSTLQDYTTKLSSAAQGGANALSGFQQNTTTNPTTNFGVNSQQQTMSDTPTLQGQISQTQKRDQFGNPIYSGLTG